MMAAILLYFFAWLEAPLFDLADTSTRITYIGHILVLGSGAFAAADVAVRKDFVEGGGYAFAWALYSVFGLIVWMLTVTFYPLVTPGADLICPAWQGPASRCPLSQFLVEQSFWTAMGFMFFLIPHAALAGLVFTIRSFGADYRSRYDHAS